MTWHADTEMLRSYAEGTLDDVHAYSLEAHLLACETCRAGVRARPDRQDAVWDEIVRVVDAPVRGPMERFLMALGVRQHVARLLAATPSLRLSWLASQAFVLALTALWVTWRQERVPESAAAFVFLTVAAVLPVIGIALAYGRGVDPTYEVGMAAPMPSFRLLLIRALAVLASSSVIALGVSATIPGLPWMAAAWIIPSLGLASATLAVSSYMRPIKAAAVVLLTWLAVAMAFTSASDALAMFGRSAQVWFASIICVSTLSLIARRGTFEQEAGS